MSIWFKDYSVEEIIPLSKNTMLEHIGIEITELGDNFIKGRMPVDRRTKQPAGLLHGGASAALAESLGSIAASLCIDPAKRHCVGIEINANHIRAVTDGYVEGAATPLHLGGKIQVWEIRISNPAGKLVCISRLTLAVLDK
ncbi:MAG: hotdog fold thioesterase [Calditrichaceae bacterium]|nr:hotdog fold thioesterase [Calditrichia bacterium]NUQ43249.1 hotdog fold thioesterase [Calditrichaceae bacterium]